MEETIKVTKDGQQIEVVAKDSEGWIYYSDGVRIYDENELFFP